MLAQPGTNRIWIKGNLGWVKHALRGGYGVVPCFSFGETEWAYQWQGG